MNKERLTAFSDGVIAIIITVMVLELKVPQGATLRALAGALPVFLSYVLSFVYVGLEQPSSHVARLCVRDGRHAVGQLTPAVLAISLPLRDRVDG